VTSRTRLCDGLGGLQGLGEGGPGSAQVFLGATPLLMHPTSDAPRAPASTKVGRGDAGTSPVWTPPIKDPASPWAPRTEAGWGSHRSRNSMDMVHKSQPHAPHLAAHLSGHTGDEAGQDGPAEHVPPQAGVLGVLQVADPASHPVAILHVCALQLLEDMWGSVKESRGQDGGMPAPRAPAVALGSVVLMVTRASAHVEVTDLVRALLPGGPSLGSGG